MTQIIKQINYINLNERLLMIKLAKKQHEHGAWEDANR